MYASFSDFKIPEITELYCAVRNIHLRRFLFCIFGV